MGTTSVIERLLPQTGDRIQYTEKPSGIYYGDLQFVKSKDLPQHLFKRLGLPENFQRYTAINRLQKMRDPRDGKIYYIVFCIGIDSQGTSHIEWSNHSWISEQEYNRVDALT